MDYHIDSIKPIKYSVIHTNVNVNKQPTHSGYSSVFSVDVLQAEDEDNKCEGILYFLIKNYNVNYECHLLL